MNGLALFSGAAKPCYSRRERLKRVAVLVAKQAVSILQKGFVPPRGTRVASASSDHDRLVDFVSFFMDVGPMLEVDQAATGERISIEDFRKIPPDDRQKMVTEIHKRMLQDALKAGHLEKYLPEYLQKGCAPSSLALVYMERWEYFTPPELRASAPLSNEVILVVTDPQNVIRKCREFSFDPNSEAAKFWKDTAPEFPLPPT